MGLACTPGIREATDTFPATDRRRSPFWFPGGRPDAFWEERMYWNQERQGGGDRTEPFRPGDTAEWVKKMLQFVPDEAQRRVLTSPRRRGILNCTRQWGKSTTAAAKAVHEAYTRAGSVTLVVSPTARQSG